MISAGVDIIEIKRFRKAKNIQRLADFFLSKKEIKLALNSRDFCQYLASRFSVKEAVIKAVPELNIGYLDFEVLKKDRIKPYINVITKKFKKYSISVSLSHTDSHAVGFAIVNY
ncbi:MAG: 4'-phosphopantetheinyl transferase superfamily protein [Candidatus Taylorbacteria bacterium]|nr:4'-phosphopantetheinyl transferase superfamily protein [Candidatus Taylorbacteria bacterium]